ncbi:MAG TPA: sigma-70 family RNA polymerase sigma factor [Planctomycetota bacterium]|nr:sigma-70 family RNA polymerase sigma factor [Planctomycetota bacterium]
MTNTQPADLVRQLLEQRDGLFGFILALTHDREAAEEVFQEVGLAVVEESAKRIDVVRFLPWVHELARRRVAEYYRRSSRRRAREHSEPLDDIVSLAFQEGAADPEALNLRQEHLETCLESLSPAQRALIERRYRDRAPLRDIASQAASTEGSVKVLLWRARRQLARCIEGKMSSAGGED